MKHAFTGWIFLLLIPSLNAQWTIGGKVTDAETGEPVPYATVVAGNNEEATTSDADGNYSIALDKPYPLLHFEAIGYAPAEIRLGRDRQQLIHVRLTPAVYEIQEVTVKPQRYTNRNNPAVELIRLVVDHRDENRPKRFSTFQEEQYEKLVVGFGNIPQKTFGKRIFRRIRFLWENVDSNKIADIDVVPLFVQENIYDRYNRFPPEEEQKLARATKSVRFKGFLDDEGIDKGLKYLYQPVDIYERNILLLTNKFPSPISNTAPLLYRYYPTDTLVEDGRKIVRLEFYPRNKYDMYLQGEMYVALDSTYPVTGIRFTINPQANLNWVQNLEVEQEFTRTPEGATVISREDFRMYFGITPNGMGIYSERFVDHRHVRINDPLPPDSLVFGPRPLSVTRRPETMADSSRYWSDHRIPLTVPESRAYSNMDSLINMPWFKWMSRLGRLLTGGYLDVAPGVEIGPIPTFLAFNDIENIRLRLSGRTRPTMSDRWQVGGSASYGFGDGRWKYGGNFAIALGKGPYHRFPYNRLTGSYEEQLALPGQSSTLNNTLGTSITRGANDRLLYSRLTKLAYEREFKSQFSFSLGIEQQSLEPAGALPFLPADGVSPEIPSLQNLRGVLSIRYAPGENIYQGQGGGRARISYRSILQVRLTHALDAGHLGNFRYDEAGLLFQKFTNLPPFGYNSTILEAGAIFGTVPYPFLIVHRANQSYFYQTNAYNLMNFMEFVSDRYAAITINQYFNGFFLNKVPLIKRLQLREILSVRLLVGSLSDRNRSTDDPEVLMLPVNADGTPITYGLNEGPYLEASLGISNIFKVLRFDVIRRFSYLDHPGVAAYGVKGTFQIEF